MNLNPNLTYFHHPVYGYQKIDSYGPGLVRFWGQKRRSRISGEGLVWEPAPKAPTELLELPTSEIRYCSEEEAREDAIARAIKDNAKIQPQEDDNKNSSTCPDDLRAKLKASLEKAKHNAAAQKKTKHPQDSKVEQRIDNYLQERIKEKAKSSPELAALYFKETPVTETPIDTSADHVSPSPSTIEPTVTKKKAKEIKPGIIGMLAQEKAEIAAIDNGAKYTSHPKKILPTPSHIRATKESEFFSGMRETMRWLDDFGLPAIPVAPIYDKARGFNGKAPSYLDTVGTPRKLKWKQYATGPVPSNKEKVKFFQNPKTGIGTLAGLQNIYFLDVDRKHFETQAACDEVGRTLWKKLGETGLFERTQSGGYRIAFKYLGAGRLYTSPISVEEGGDSIGEVLGYSPKNHTPQFAILAPTIGVVGAYESLHRCREIPAITKLEALGIFPTKPVGGTGEGTNGGTDGGTGRIWENRELMRFPALLYNHYQHASKIWLLARGKDDKGSGMAILSLEELMETCKRSEASIRRWLKKGIAKKLFSARGYTGEDGKIYFKIFYRSKERAIAQAGLSALGPVGLISRANIESLHLVATEIIALDIQKSSRYLALKEKCEEVARRDDIPLEFAIKKAIKPLAPRKLTASTCEKKPARVLKVNNRWIYASEGLAAYGASLESVAVARGLSKRQTNRHLVQTYRAVPSPIRGFRSGCKSIQKRQIIQRRRKIAVDAAIFEAKEAHQDIDGKFYRDKDGRIWERLPSVIAPDFQLVRCRFRRRRIASF